MFRCEFCENYHDKSEMVLHPEGKLEDLCWECGMEKWGCAECGEIKASTHYNKHMDMEICEDCEQAAEARFEAIYEDCEC